MCCEQLVCASCSGRVVDARCPVCRQMRSDLHHHSPDWQAFLVPVLAALAAIACLLAYYVRIA